MEQGEWVRLDADRRNELEGSWIRFRVISNGNLLTGKGRLHIQSNEDDPAVCKVAISVGDTTDRQYFDDSLIHVPGDAVRLIKGPDTEGVYQLETA